MKNKPETHSNCGNPVEIKNIHISREFFGDNCVGNSLKIPYCRKCDIYVVNDKGKVHEFNTNKQVINYIESQKRLK